MSDTIEVSVPEIGDFEDVEVVEVIASAGEVLEEGQSLITLESEKASVEVPAPRAGTVERMLVEAGDRVSAGTPIALLRIGGGEPASLPETDASEGVESAPRAPSAHAGRDADLEAEVLVLGGGPGGYTAAFRSRRPGETHGARGALRSTRGRVPQRRLHPVQGPAPQRRGDRGRGRAGRARDRVRDAGNRRREARQLEGRRGGPPVHGSRGAPPGAAGCGW